MEKSKQYTDRVTTKDTVVYSDGRYTLGLKDGEPYFTAGGKRYTLTCHPYEPCLYITDEGGFMAAVHNSFEPLSVLEEFAAGGTVTSVTGFEYDAEDFCKMAEYAKDMGNINIDDAEKIFGNREKTKAATKAAVKGGLSSSPIVTEDPFYKIIAEYPDSVTDFCIVKDGMDYRGYQSHWRALKTACKKLFFDKDGVIWNYDVGNADGAEISIGEFLAAAAEGEKINYRGAFLHPPLGDCYTDSDFERINSVLFPGGTDGLEIYKWTTDWSEYFDDGHEWWGALCLTVYDKSLDRFIIILASATD